MIRVQFDFHDRVSPSFDWNAVIQRVPVVGDVINHGDREYIVSAVILYTDGSDPYVVAKVPL